MVLGRLTHYALDLALVSTVLAGIKRHTGYTPKIKQLPEGAPQALATSYLQAGEKIFDYVSAYSLTSSYFHRGSNDRSEKSSSWAWGSKSS